MKQFAIIIPLLAAFSVLSSAQAPRCSAQKLKDDVSFLCDPGLAGRVCGGPGTFELTRFIASSMRDAGLQPLDGSYFDSFTTPDGAVGRNVVGILPGRTRRWVLVGSYFDGLPSADGHVYPGADSNASGVAALLAVARLLTAGGDGVIFVAFDGHHSMYSGASHIAKRLRRSNMMPRLMVNIDIVGSSLAPMNYNKRHLIALGGFNYYRNFDKARELSGISTYYDYYGSRDFSDLFGKQIGDQTVFLKYGIPCVVFTSGITDNTNKDADTPETLDYEVFRSRVVHITSWLKKTIR